MSGIYFGGKSQGLLTILAMQIRMSETGDGYDNALMESFFGTLKGARVHLQDYLTRREAKTDIFAYFEGFYNRTRRHSSLGYLSPNAFERRYYDNLS